MQCNPARLMLALLLPFSIMACDTGEESDGGGSDGDSDSDTDSDSDSDADTDPDPDPADPFAVMELFTSEG